MKKLIIIAAIGKNNELGKNNDLIWKIKGDLKFFKENTINHHVVMGKNTFLSLPSMLKDRVHLVLNNDDYKFPDSVIVLRSLDEFFKISKEIDDDIYVIGGASIYKQFIDYADCLILTEIDALDKDADVYFPKIDYKKYDKKIIEEHNDNNISYKHVIYKRKSCK